MSIENIQSHFIKELESGTEVPDSKFFKVHAALIVQTLSNARNDSSPLFRLREIARIHQSFFEAWGEDNVKKPLFDSLNLFAESLASTLCEKFEGQFLAIDGNNTMKEEVITKKSQTFFKDLSVLLPYGLMTMKVLDKIKEHVKNPCKINLPVLRDDQRQSRQAKGQAFLDGAVEFESMLQASDLMTKTSNDATARHSKAL